MSKMYLIFLDVVVKILLLLYQIYIYMKYPIVKIIIVEVKFGLYYNYRAERSVETSMRLVAKYK